MSFAHDVKSELCSAEIREECKKAELYGLLLFGRSFGPGGLSLQTVHEGVAQTAAGLLKALYGVQPAVRTGARSSGNQNIIISVEERDAAARIYRSFGYDEKTVSLRINRAVVDEGDGAPAFLRGAFLSCGSMVDPGKDYHLEFVTSRLHLCRDLSCLLAELGFSPKLARRKGGYVLYFKESGQIEDMLTLMGAARQSLKLMNVKVYKDIRNKANRVANCDTANIGKTVDASTEQIEAIRKLYEAVGPEGLPVQLREVAQLRLENPDLSLRELGQMLSVRLSRSGVNHRLQKLIEMANKL